MNIEDAGVEPIVPVEDVTIDTGGVDTPEVIEDGAYQVPEGYRDRSWAKDIKSEEDVYKQLDGTQELIGKKSLPPKFDEMTEQQISEYYTASRPEKAEDYVMPESFSSVEKDYFAKAFHEEGLSAYRGQKLAERYEAMNTEIKEKTYGEKGWKEILKRSFGDDFESKGGELTGFMKMNATESDQKFIDAAPNEVMGAFYRILDNVKQAYGVKESGTGGKHPAGVTGLQDKGAMQSDLRNQIIGLSKRPHSSDEKQVLIDKLNATYK